MSLRIVHIISSLKVGGMEHFAVRLAARQRTGGADASILALQGGPLSEECETLRLPVSVLGGSSRVLRVAKAVAHFVRSQPDIVHGHNVTSLQYAMLAKRFTKAKIVLTCHGRGKADYQEPPAEMWGGVDRVACVSEAVAKETPTTVDRSRLSVIRNGVDIVPPTRSRENVREELGIGGAFCAIIVARIDHMKGHDTLLRAWSEVYRAHKSAILLIVGDGAERAAMERLASELNIAEGVRFLGFRTDVGDLLGTADLFVLPSLSEGLPLSILEAMTHGLPTVATDVGGIPEVVTHERDGLLVAVNDEASLAAAILRLHDCAEIRSRYGQNARQRVAADFSFEAMVSAYSDLYRSALT